jgi:hypothetical protein
MVIDVEIIYFSFTTLDSHTFTGMITVSAYDEADTTVVQIPALIRASDPTSWIFGLVMSTKKG